MSGDSTYPDLKVGRPHQGFCVIYHLTPSPLRVSLPLAFLQSCRAQAVLIHLPFSFPLNPGAFWVCVCSCEAELGSSEPPLH